MKALTGNDVFGIFLLDMEEFVLCLSAIDF